jgi:glycosyltransferase involved in cell wall biosynthesis
VKVLLLHQHFNTPETGGALRSYYLAKALADAGIGVIVIAAGNSPQTIKKRVDGVEVYYLPVAYDNRFGFAARVWAFAKYVWGVVRLYSALGNFDFCYAISTPLTVGFAARWIKMFRSIPYFFEVGDLWPEAPIQMGFISNPVFKKALYQLEKSIYQSAHAIVALSPAILSAIEKKVTEKKIHLIPNMADCDFFLPEAKDPELETKYGVKNKFVVSYIGAVGLANGLDYFLECANLSRKADLPIHFFICGDGALLERLKLNARQLDLHNLTFTGFTNRAGVKELLNVTDAAFICYKPVPVLETGSPNKYFDGLASGKLIIINFGGWIKTEMEEYECGIFVDPKHPTDFIKKITPFLSDREKLKKFQTNARGLAERRYSRRALSEEFLKIFNHHQ